MDSPCSHVFVRLVGCASGMAPISLSGLRGHVLCIPSCYVSDLLGLIVDELSTRPMQQNSSRAKEVVAKQA